MFFTRVGDLFGEWFGSPWSRQRRLIQARDGYDASSFAQHFGREPDIADELWAALVREAVVPGFVPRPEDDLLKVWGLADEDLDEMVLDLLKRCQCRIPSNSETDSMPAVRTVADLFAFLEEMRNSSHRFACQPS